MWADVEGFFFTDEEMVVKLLHVYYCVFSLYDITCPGEN